MAVVLFCLAVCFILAESADISCVHPDSERSPQSCFLEGDGGCAAQAACGSSWVHISTFPHGAFNENSNKALLTLSILTVFLSRLMRKINWSYWFSQKNHFHHPLPSVHSPITNVLATYDAELPQWIPYFRDHRMSQICSAFMKAPQWPSWPRLTWPSCPDCAIGSWAQSDYLLSTSLSSLTLAGGWLLC